eukprot:m.164002 g.164002  ORF g.164002 m.164002 type:complete len:418 (-) comp12366_c0_seq1:1553-2806(-)
MKKFCVAKGKRKKECLFCQRTICTTNQKWSIRCDSYQTVQQQDKDSRHRDRVHLLLKGKLVPCRQGRCIDLPQSHVASVLVRGVGHLDRHEFGGRVQGHNGRGIGAKDARVAPGNVPFFVHPSVALTHVDRCVTEQLWVLWVIDNPHLHTQTTNVAVAFHGDKLTSIGTPSHVTGGEITGDGVCTVFWVGAVAQRHVVLAIVVLSPPRCHKRVLCRRLIVKNLVIVPVLELPLKHIVVGNVLVRVKNDRPALAAPQAALVRMNIARWVDTVVGLPSRIVKHLSQRTRNTALCAPRIPTNAALICRHITDARRVVELDKVQHARALDLVLHQVRSVANGIDKRELVGVGVKDKVIGRGAGNRACQHHSPCPVHHRVGRHVDGRGEGGAGLVVAQLAFLHRPVALHDNGPVCPNHRHTH